MMVEFCCFKLESSVITRPIVFGHLVLKLIFSFILIKFLFYDKDIGSSGFIHNICVFCLLYEHKVSHLNICLAWNKVISIEHLVTERLINEQSL